MKHGAFVSAAWFMEAVTRRAGTTHLLPVPDPLAQARDLILNDWGWYSGALMYDLLWTLNGSQDDYMEGEEDAFDVEELSIATALMAAKRIGMYPESEWKRVMDQVEQLIAKLDEFVWQ